MLKTIRDLSRSYGTWQVFSDFLSMAANAISNSVDTQNFKSREENYLAIIKKYTPDEQKLFPELFACLVLALEKDLETKGFVDVLGVLFHELELHNHYVGQFFTPQNVCNMMGEITIGEPATELEEKGFISVLEPCIGSGAMVLGFAQAFSNRKFNPQKQLVVKGIDIDIKCVHMTYIQLSLYGIPAVVVHGNTLTNEEWSHWYTPTYILGGWSRKIGG